MSKRVGLFGGTFDPVHIGHIAIVDSFLRSRLIDELWILLTPFPPHKQDKQHISYKDRKNMLDLAFNDHNNVKVCTVERDLPKPSYTVRTIQYLQNKHKGVDFYLCIGEDSLANFDTWKDYEKILNICDLLVAERPGVSHDKIEQNIIEKAFFVKHEPIKVSSTTIRSLISSGETVKHLLAPQVNDYIMDNDLYQ